MKILRNEPHSLYNSVNVNSNTNKNNNCKVESTTSNDKVIISKKAKEYSSVNVFTDTVIKEVNDNTPSEKLLKLKDAISSGNYNIPSENIADAIFGKQTK